MNEASFWGLIKKTRTCWEWLGSKSRGYGRFGSKSAHRISYELLKGLVASDIQIEVTDETEK